MEDLISQRPEGLIRMKTSNVVMLLPASPLESHAFGLLRNLALFVSRVLKGPSLGQKREIHMATINLCSHDSMLIRTLKL